MKRLCSVVVGIVLLSMLTSCVFVTRGIEEDRLAHLHPEIETGGPCIDGETADFGNTITTPTESSALAVATTTTYQETSSPVSDDVFVRVKEYIPDLVIDLKYATTENFTGQVIYRSDEAWLRYGTVKKMILVQQELSEQGLGLKLWDGFRPTTAQIKLWQICPDPTYVSDPNNGFSNHSRGNTVDITLVDIDGQELIMPTGFDDFSVMSDRDYSDCSQEAADNARYLEQVMQRNGFKGYYGEWWHYTDTDTYDVEFDFAP